MYFQVIILDAHIVADLFSVIFFHRDREVRSQKD